VLVIVLRYIKAAEQTKPVNSGAAQPSSAQPQERAAIPTGSRTVFAEMAAAAADAVPSRLLPAQSGAAAAAPPKRTAFDSAMALVLGGGALQPQQAKIHKTKFT
jgi:hypothetical protein